MLIPGAGIIGAAFEATADALRTLGHDAVCVDLPCEDADAGLPEYTRAALEAIGDRDELIVVGHSLGAFTALQLTDECHVKSLVLLCPMIPLPGEAPGQ